GEHYVGPDRSLDLLEVLLDRRACLGKEAFPERVDLDGRRAGTGEHLGRRFPRLRLAARVGREYDPVDRGSRVLGEEAEDRAAGADLQVVAVGSQAEDGQRCAGLAQAGGQHQDRTVASGMGTTNFAPQERAWVSCVRISSLKFQ